MVVRSSRLYQLLFLLLVCSVYSGQSTTTDDYIVHVTPSCGATVGDDSTITVVTDMDVHAAALCKDVGSPRSVSFVETENSVLHTATIKTSGSGSDCIFYKKENSEIYTIVVEISYGEPGAFIHNQHQSYLITCTYDQKGANVLEGTSRTIDEALIQPMELQGNMGGASNATFTLVAMDILDSPITTVGVAIGRQIYLRGTLSGGTGLEPGVRVVSCVASSGTSYYSVLRGGCGDGIVFNKADGFTTVGLKTNSPYFRAFKLHDGLSVRFECNFTVCTTNCDGSSCTNVAGRKKRAAQDTGDNGLPEEMFSASSAYMPVHNRTCDKLPQRKLKNGILVLAYQYKMSPSDVNAEKPELNVLLVSGVVSVLVGLVIVAMGMCRNRYRKIPAVVLKNVTFWKSKDLLVSDEKERDREGVNDCHSNQ